MTETGVAVTAPRAPSITSTLPSEWYHGESQWELDRRAVFSREWAVVGHVSDLRAAGSYLATDIAGSPVVIVRGADGALSAFHNVCRHRAGPLVWDGTGHVSSFVCRYHGWVYELDGRLRSPRDFGDDPPLDRGACGLFGATVDVWRGLVWANLDPAAPALSESLGGFAEATAGFPMEELVPAHELSHEIVADWKVYAENYLEGYHIPLVHRELNREIDAARYEVHVGDRWCRHEAPTRSGAVNAGRWLWRWPNVALNLYPDSMNLERFLPTGPGRVRISYRYFTRDGISDDEVVRISSTVLEEDARICAAVQRNLAAGTYRSGVLSPRHEDGVAAFQHLVRTARERLAPA